MEKSVNYEGKNYKIFPVKTFGETYQVIVVERRYRTNDTLALEVISLEDVDGNIGPEDSFGTLTLNLAFGLASRRSQYVKNYSENEEWAEKLAKAIGGKETGHRMRTGYVEVPLYDFSNLDIYAD